VTDVLQAWTTNKTICQLFGGLASFGVRLDIDPAVRPNVIGDAWLPPFRQDAFDVVILDPPYLGINQQTKQQLFRGASFIARQHVIWFHTVWMGNGGNDGLRLERGWLVRVGDSCQVRCLQVFRVQPGPKVVPRPYFTRGPAIRYNRWLTGQLLPLPLV